MYARAVGKGVAPHYGFVWLYGHVHKRGNQTAYSANFGGVYVCFYSKLGM